MISFLNSFNFPFSQFFFLVFIFLLSGSCQSTNGQDSYSDIIGQPAPDWEHENWLHSAPLTLENLKGKVILLRWWTDGCPYCIATSDALNEFYKKHQSKGLEIIGFYHPKPNPSSVSMEDLKEYTAKKEFQFPVALDENWTTLRKYWLDGDGRNFTSVSFLIDKKGIIRHLHPGGEYHKDGTGEHAQCRLDYLEMKRMIEVLLSE